MGLRKRPDVREGYRLIDRGRPYEWMTCACGKFRVHYSHTRCRACQRPRACGERGWRVCGQGRAGCGPFCQHCAPTHNHPIGAATP